MMSRIHALLVVMFIGTVAASSRRISAQNVPPSPLSISAERSELLPGEMLHLTISMSEVKPSVAVTLLSRGLFVGKQPPEFEGMSLYAQIPLSTLPGKYTLQAIAASGTNGAVVRSNTLEINVPIEKEMTNLRIANKKLNLKYYGQSIPIDALVETKSGLVMPSAASFTYASRDPSVASVDGDGRVTAQSAGKTTVEVSYSTSTADISKEVNVDVEANIAGDFNGDRHVDQEDISILKAWIGHPVNGTHDARDINHDGSITENDVEALKRLCSERDCVSAKSMMR